MARFNLFRQPFLSLSLSLSLFNSTILIILRNLVLSFLTLLYSFLILPYISFLYGVLFTVLRPEYPVIRNRITTASLSADFPCSRPIFNFNPSISIFSLWRLTASLSSSLPASLSLSQYPCLTPYTRQLLPLAARSSPSSRVRSFFSWRWRYSCADTGVNLDSLYIHFLFGVCKRKLVSDIF